MKDERYSKLLLEQIRQEKEHLNEQEITAYQTLFDLLEAEKAHSRQIAEQQSIVEETMAHIVFLEEQKDKRRDAINVGLGLFIGVLAIAISYFFIDRPLLQALLNWITVHASILLFSLATVVLIQWADKRLVRRQNNHHTSTR
ncbi:hypothetical protein [Olivibacter sp. XZL3]|uniref:hypothetical protein n=1 Tax=Olivibacter sp. XZL3 TaxID=1735116 RepID=UPI0010670DBE|nr:hypothetical protein [Olivibacter sp. XZL3]